MAALLVGMAVMAIMLTVAMPTWSQMIRRDKEEELVFRGNQYARAINLYQRRFANASPPSIDVLVEQRLLRKKFRDPMSSEKSGEFQLLYVSNSAASSRQGGANQLGAAQSSIGSVLGTTPTGGIAGVTSKNKSESIRVFNGKSHYNEWQFVGMQQSAQGGAGGPGGPAGQGGRQGSVRPDGSFVGREGGRNVDTRGSGFGGGGGGGRTGPGPGPGGQQGPPQGQGQGRGR